MKFLYDLFPLLLFFAAFKLYDIYVATAVAIAASFVQVGAFWWRHHRFETMHLVTLAVIVVFGGLTLAMWGLAEDPSGECKVEIFQTSVYCDTFIRWKPTLVYWILSGFVLGSQLLGEKTLIERMLGSQISLPPQVWSRQNLSWGIFFFVLGTVNLYVAFYYGSDLDRDTQRTIWVNFKVFGLLGLTLAFTLLQGALIARYVSEKPTNDRRTP